MSRLTNDMDTISGTVAQSATQLISGVLTVIGTLTMMLVLSPLLSLAVFVTIPLIYLPTRIVTKRTGKLFREQQAYLGVMNSHIEETISGIQTVRAYGRERQVIEHFDELNETLCDVGDKGAHLVRLHHAAFERHQQLWLRAYQHVRRHPLLKRRADRGRHRLVRQPCQAVHAPLKRDCKHL